MMGWKKNGKNANTMDNTKMTNGPITTILLSFAGPVLLGQLLQQLYNIADAAIVGQFLSSKALAAVGATSSLTYIVCYFCIGSCIGISVPVSQAFGAGKNTDLRKYFINGVYFCTCDCCHYDSSHSVYEWTLFNVVKDT